MVWVPDKLQLGPHSNFNVSVNNTVLLALTLTCDDIATYELPKVPLRNSSLTHSLKRIIMVKNESVILQNLQYSQSSLNGYCLSGNLLKWISFVAPFRHNVK